MAAKCPPTGNLSKRSRASVLVTHDFADARYVAADDGLANRTGLAPGKNVLEVEKRLEKFTPEEFKRHAHLWLILHGRYVCKARSPECARCIIADLCEYRHKTVRSG